MSAGEGNADFSTGAELSLSIPGREISELRSQIESGLSDIPVGVDASGVDTGQQQQPRDPSTGQFMSIEGVEQRIIEQTEEQVGLLDDIYDTVDDFAEGGGGPGRGVQAIQLEVMRRTLTAQQASADFDEERNVILHDIKDELEGGVGGGGGGGGTLGGLARGLGAGLGGGVGLTALGIGTGVGVGALGIGAGVGAATGQFSNLETFNVQTGNISVEGSANFSGSDFDITGLQGPLVENPQFSINPQLGPENFVIGEDAFSFSAGDIGIGEDAFSFSAGDIGIGDNAFQFNPQFGPENFDFSPQIGPEKFDLRLGPEDFELNPSIGDISVRSDIDFNPSLSISPTINLTGIDLSGLSVDLTDEIINSRQFQNQLDSAIGDAVDDLEGRIIGQLP